MSRKMGGGCQCGRIRYTVAIETDEAYLCHCRMCQRATGGVSIAFKNVPKSALEWSQDPDWYHSSEIARRPYCAHCGTPLGFEYPDSENADLTVGSFDDPSGFRPTSHFGVESMHEAWLDTSHLPRHRADEHAPLLERWEKAGGRPE
ncbi:MAG: GFA family protein [Sphingomonadales bacterium]|nr:GFA family protein [Sphingomonadales bacterium]